MANRGEAYSPDIHCVYVETNIDTRLALLLHKDDTVSLFNDNFCKEHKQSFPEIGEVRISAVKVRRGDHFYYLPDSMIVSKVFEGIRENWFIDVDAVRVEKCGDVLTIKAQNCSKSELPARGKEIANCSDETKTKKRKMKSSGGKRFSVDLEETAVATRCDVDESHELCGKLQVEAVASASCGVEMLSDDLRGAKEKDLEKGEETVELVKIDQEKDLATTLELADGNVTSRDAVDERDEGTLVASGAQNAKPIKVVEDCDEEIAGKDLASKVEDSATEIISVQNVGNTKMQKKAKKRDVDQYAPGAEGVDKVEVKTKKRKRKSEKKKQSCEDHKTDDLNGEKDDVSVPRNEEKPEFNGEKRETYLSSPVLIHNNVAQEVPPLKTRVSPRCSCEGQRARKLVVFDLNGIFADIVQEYRGPFVPDGRISNRSVFRRPFVASFLDFCFERFDVGIWSSRRIGLEYMTNIVFGKHARNLLFSFDQYTCTTTRFNTLEKSSKPLFLKDLRRVWNRYGKCFICRNQKYDETNTILVDDSPHKALCNPPHTGIFPHPYQYTDREDSALGPDGELRKYMERLADTRNIRKFVEENPFGQAAINERHESWEFYSKVIEAYK